MTDHELSNYLAAKCAAVVHLSHHAVMNAERPIWPDDMRRAIAKRDEFKLSCVVVWPGHHMRLPGSVGVIFSPICKNVISVAGCDSGSTETGSLGMQLSFEGLEATFNVSRDAYNEWEVRGADVVGIFVDNPSNIEVKKKTSFSLEGQTFEETVACSISIDEVLSTFPDLPIFTMGTGGLVEIPRS